MIFVDANVVMYAVGGKHPLQDDARSFFLEMLERREILVTSAEVLQELLHAYVPVNRLQTLDAALDLVDARFTTIWPVEAEDIRRARGLIGRHPELQSRDLVHLACCLRRDVRRVKTYDRPLGAAFDS